MRRVLYIISFTFLVACSPDNKESGPLLLDAKLYVNGDTMVFVNHQISFDHNVSGDELLQIRLFGDGFEQAIFMGVNAGEPGTYQVQEGFIQDYAYFTFYGHSHQDTSVYYTDINIAGPTDSNVVIIDHLSPLKTSGNFSTYLHAVQDSIIINTHLATGYFDFVAQ
jgi:hypothetical protein